MVYRLVDLRIDRVVAHQIFRRNITGEMVDPHLSQECTVLPQPGLTTLQTRITEALGNDSHCIEMYVDQDGPSSVYDHCNHLLGANEADFITISQAVADKLSCSQGSRKIPGGIVIVFDGSVGHQDHRFIGIIKAELQEGFCLETAADRLLLTFISELLLTPSQKFYKIGAFIETNRLNDPAHRTPDDYVVLVYDHNLMTRAEEGQAARYFYETFLGCRFSPSDKKLTSDFFYKTREYIDELQVTEEERLDLQSSLYGYLKVAQSNVVEVSRFAQEYLSPELRDGYRNHMTRNNLPDHAFTKDLSYLKNRLKRRNIHFSSNVRISAPSDRFRELVEIRNTENGRTIVAIEGTVERAD